ncbi:MAG: Asp23/Gls24 family envelope stress response protein [Chloroflexota bacterium]
MSESFSTPTDDGKLAAQGMEPMPEDRVTIAPSALLTVIRMAALQIKGVARIGNTPGGVNLWLRRTASERGVQVMIDDQTVTIDLYIVVEANANLREISYNVQRQVARDIEENVGMHLGAINIHIEDVVFESQPE